MTVVLELLKAHPTYAYLFPFLVLSAVALLILVFDLLLEEDRKHVLGWLAIAGMVYAASYLLAPRLFDFASPHTRPMPLAWTMLRFDNFSRAFNLMFLASGILVVLLALRYKPLKRHVGEFYMFLMLAVSAFMLLAASMNFLMIYLSIEYVAVCSYVLAAYLKDDPKSQEGALKYLLLGATASAFLLYGISILFGLTGSLYIPDVARALHQVEGAHHTLTLLTFVFLLAGFGFKIAMVPFHTWCPDAYEGAPTPVTAFFSVAPKAAGVAVLLRVSLTVFQGLHIAWVPLIEILAIVTMTVGNVIALWQTNIKRLMAYSSIAHVGYILIGLVVAGALGVSDPFGLGAQGLKAAMVYVAAYVIMNLGAFAVIIIVSNQLGSDRIEHYAGLGKRAPFLAVALTVFFLSLAGIPPTVGFIGKFYLFKAAVETDHYLLAIFLLVNSVTSVYYYWNVVRTMFIDEPEEPARVRGALPLWAVTAVTLAAVLGLGILFEQFVSFFQNSLLII